MLLPEVGVSGWTIIELFSKNPDPNILKNFTR
jgi:hypothetical protein